MPYDKVTVFVYHHFYLFQIVCFYVMLFIKRKFCSVPHILCIATFSNHMNMYRFVVVAEKQKSKAKGSEYFRYVLYYFYHTANIGIIFDTS